MSEKTVHTSEEMSSPEDVKTMMMGAQALDYPDAVAGITFELAHRVLDGGIYQQLGTIPEDVDKTELMLETIESGVTWMQRRLKKY